MNDNVYVALVFYLNVAFNLLLLWKQKEFFIMKTHQDDLGCKIQDIVFQPLEWWRKSLEAGWSEAFISRAVAWGQGDATVG